MLIDINFKGDNINIGIEIDIIFNYDDEYSYIIESMYDMNTYDDFLPNYEQETTLENYIENWIKDRNSELYDEYWEYINDKYYGV